MANTVFAPAQQECATARKDTSTTPNRVASMTTSASSSERATDELRAKTSTEVDFHDL